MAYTTIDNPGLFFNTITYSGNGSNPRTLTGVGFQPDWVWQKNRTDSNGHTLADAVRGANKTLSSDGTGAEQTDKSDGHLDAFTSDGFTVGAGSSSDARVNDGSHTYVAWNWKANGSGSSNGDGSITSTVSANTTAGFSIISYTGTGSNATVGHGLGSVPKWIITKRYDGATENWGIYHASTGNTKYLFLNKNNSVATSSAYWNDTTPTSSVFSIGTNDVVNTSSGVYIAYCFAEKQGYSKFGKYTGNGNANGTFVYTGFKPAWILIKDTGSTQSWFMYDNKRDTINPNTKLLTANNSSAEEDSASTGNTFDVDFLSNSVKIRTTDGGVNTSGNEYVYSVFAENPFVTEGTKAAGTAK